MIWVVSMICKNDKFVNLLSTLLL